MTDEETSHLAQNDEKVDRVDSDSDEGDIGENVSHKEATKAFEICIKYLEQQPDAKACELMLLQQLYRSSVLRTVTSLKQSTIADYFKL